MLYYRLNTGPKGRSFAGLWTESSPGSIYRTILEKNMDESSYNNVKKSVKKVIDLPNQAFYGSFGPLLKMRVHCKVNNFSWNYLICANRMLSISFQQ